jgi:hypothetical protein
MVQIPDNSVGQKDLEEWYLANEQLAKLKAREMMLRKRIFNHYFPTPKEGTNDAELPDGYVLKATYPITRTVDEAGLSVLKEQFVEAKISTDKLVSYKPSLVVSEYRTLTAEQQQLFDQALIIKPGTPALEIVQPKKPKQAKEKP